MDLWPWPLQSALTWFHAAVASVGAMKFFSEIFGGDLLVVQTDIRTPDVIRRYVQHVNSAVLGRFPLQLVIVPILKKTKTHTSDSFAYGCSRVLMGHQRQLFWWLGASAEKRQQWNRCQERNG